MFNEGLQRAIQLESVCDDCNDVTLGSFIDPNKATLVTQTNSSGQGPASMATSALLATASL